MLQGNPSRCEPKEHSINFLSMQYFASLHQITTKTSIYESFLKDVRERKTRAIQNAKGQEEMWMERRGTVPKALVKHLWTIPKAIRPKTFSIQTVSGTFPGNYQSLVKCFSIVVWGRGHDSFCQSNVKAATDRWMDGWADRWPELLNTEMQLQPLSLPAASLDFEAAMEGEGGNVSPNQSLTADNPSVPSRA